MLRRCSSSGDLYLPQYDQSSSGAAWPDIFCTQGLFPDSAGARIRGPAGHRKGVWPSALPHTYVARTGACALTASPVLHCKIARGEMPASRNAAARAEALELLRSTSDFADRCGTLECSWRRFVRLGRVLGCGCREALPGALHGGTHMLRGLWRRGPWGGLRWDVPRV